MRIRIVSIISAMAAARVFAADAGVAFTGVLVAGGETRFALTHQATGTMRWVEADGTFYEYSVGHYDERAGILTLRKDGETHRIALAPPGTATDGADQPAIGTAAATPATAPADPPGGPPPSSAAMPAPPIPTESVPEPSPLPTNPVGPPAGSAAPEPPAERAAAAADPAPPGTAGSKEPASSATAPPYGSTYVVQPGDTPAGIALAAGITIEQLQALNPDWNAGSLQAGQAIRIRQDDLE